MLKKKNIHRVSHKILSVLLVGAFVLGAIGAAAIARKATSDFSTSTLKQGAEKPTVKKRVVKKKKRRSAGTLLTQLVIPPEVLNPLTVCIYAPAAKPEYKAEFISPETDVWAQEGETVQVSMYAKNTGNTPWFSDASGCKPEPFVRLGTARERDRTSTFYNPGDPKWLAPNRIAMVETRVDPGEIATFTFTSKMPRVADIFREYFQPVMDGKGWIENKEATGLLDIYVGENDETNEKRLYYLNRSAQASSLDISGESMVEIDISDQKLFFKFGDTVIREYTVSTGTFKTPTPLGRFQILNKQELRIGGAKPHYRMPKWQGFTKWGHGLHALPYLANDRGVFWNEALSHIGQRVSHGCVRMLPEDAEDLYKLTEVGTVMVIHN